MTQVLLIAGVNNSNEIIGKNIRIDHTSDRVYGIGHITKDKWFYPEEDLKTSNQR